MRPEAGAVVQENLQPIEIRAFSKADGDRVRSLILGIQRGEFGMSISAADQPDLADIPGFYQNKKGNFWVAERGGEIIGTVGLLDIGESEGALRKLFVDAAFRGPHVAIADRLLDALLTSANRSGMTRIFLGTAEWFHAAHKFYRRRGFEEIAPESLPQSFPRMSVDSRFFAIRTGAGEELTGSR
jgi:N-acetylglutamate synthase-like GNAT family acetyltransferase